MKWNALRAGKGTIHWGGTWTSSQRMINGQAVTIVHLNDALPGDISADAHILGLTIPQPRW